MPVTIGVTVGACLVASYFDVRSRRIPNWLTGSLAVGALALHGFAGLRAAALSLAVMAALTLLGTLIYSRGGIGGGDVKLAIAASGMLSYPLCLPFLLYTMLGGGLLAVGFILARGNFGRSLSRATAMAAGAPHSFTNDKANSLPYAVAFAFGAVVLTLSQSVAPFLRILS
ncbi:MAG TPA: prepilin peptidase [Candidatus Tumulicola sp.]|jgi:Flp pilus assembly protein protease CpaA